MREVTYSCFLSYTRNIEVETYTFIRVWDPISHLTIRIAGLRFIARTWRRKVPGAGHTVFVRFVCGVPFIWINVAPAVLIGRILALTVYIVVMVLE